MPKKLQLISIMSELGAGTRGASLGFDALRMASIKTDRNFFARYPVKKVKTSNEKLFKKSSWNFAKRLDGIAEMYVRIEEAVSEVIAKDSFPFVVSGDHSNAGGTIAGLKAAWPDKRLGVIWIDAHADLHSPFTSPSGNVHGMPLATALNEDNFPEQNHQPDEEIIMLWNKMKGAEQRIRHSDLFFVGVRDTEEPEINLMKRHDMPNITTEILREKGVQWVAGQALEHLAECDLIYISFDVDSMDPSVSRGTGTPVENGLLKEEAAELLLLLLNDHRVCCMEVTEINPLLDNRNIMAETTFEIIKPVMEKIENNYIYS